MKLSEIAPLVEQITGVRRSRATLYNWAKRGVKVGGEVVRLRVERRAGQFFVTEEDLKLFLSIIGAQQ